MQPLLLNFYHQDPLVIGRHLLGKHLVCQAPNKQAPRVFRIVETEAYTVGDVASHGFRGKTTANAAMFGPAGTAYVHINYGIHHCLNVVVGDSDVPEAILLRAIEPIDTDYKRIQYSLYAGPGRLCKTLGIVKSLHNGMLLTEPSGAFYLAEGEEVPDSNVTQTTRVGLSKGAEMPWRWYITTSPMVSRR
jgi:DNA-3-methyladenine glycosylase